MIRVESAGNIPILPRDYELPISFVFGDDDLVLNAEVVDASPSDLPVVATSESTSATLSSQLLNPGDTFTVRVLVENPGGKVRSTARIAGVRKLESETPVSIAGPVASIVGLLLIGAMFLSPEPRSQGLAEIRPEELPYAIAGLVGILLSAMGGFASLRVLVRRWRTKLALRDGNDA